MPADIPVADWAPTSCTLPSVEVPLRLAEFDQLFAQSVSLPTRPEPTTLELVLPLAVEQAAHDLTALESNCCSFFTFVFEHRAGTDGVVLRIGVPEDRVEVLHAIAERIRVNGDGR